MAPRLKVFVTSDGLTDYVVATSSKAKALAAWGSHQDLFKAGEARETDDAALVKAATAKPGEVLRRPADGRGKLAAMKAPKAKPAKAKPVKPAPTAAQRRKVEALERQLAKLEDDHRRTLARLEQQREAVARELKAARAAYAKARGEVQAELKAAKRARG